MRIRMLTIFTLMAFIISACGSDTPPREILMEVTKVVTVVVTAQPDETIQSPATPEATTEATNAEATAEVITNVEVTEEPEVESTLEATLSAASANATPVPPNFPTPVIGQVYVAEQSFQDGRMFWLEPSNQIWILAQDDQGNQRWLVFDNSWEDSMPENDPSIQPPEAGLFQPIRGFGKLWRENQNVRDLLGWAVDPEFGHVTRYEFRAGGTINADGEYERAPGTHVIIALNGDILEINEATRTWTKTN